MEASQKVEELDVLLMSHLQNATTLHLHAKVCKISYYVSKDAGHKMCNREFESLNSCVRNMQHLYQHRSNVIKSKKHTCQGAMSSFLAWPIRMIQLSVLLYSHIVFVSIDSKYPGPVHCSFLQRRLSACGMAIYSEVLIAKY